MSAAVLRRVAAMGLALASGLAPVCAAPAPPPPALRADPPAPVPRPRDLDRPPELPIPLPPPAKKPAAAMPPAATVAKPAEMQGPPMPPRKAPAAPPAPASLQPPPAADCMAQLRAAGVVFEPTVIGPQPQAACVVTEPVKLTGLNPASGLPVDFPDRPTLACSTALVFADYLRMLLVPLTRGQFGSAITAIGTGPGLECRTRDRIPGAKISAHGMGLAVDVAAVTLSNGRTLAIGAPKDDGERAFDRAARAGACGFFHTALGPGADAFHESHWHFDLQPRGKSGDSKVCQ